MQLAECRHPGALMKGNFVNLVGVSRKWTLHVPKNGLESAQRHFVAQNIMLWTRYVSVCVWGGGLLVRNGR